MNPLPSLFQSLSLHLLSLSSVLPFAIPFSLLFHCHCRRLHKFLLHFVSFRFVLLLCCTSQVACGVAIAFSSCSCIYSFLSIFSFISPSPFQFSFSFAASTLTATSSRVRDSSLTCFFFFKYNRKHFAE